MKSSSEKSATTTTTPAAQQAERPFFEKSGGGNFFEPSTKNGPPPVQMKLTVNQPGDKFEQEADRMAERVVDTKSSEPCTTCGGKSNLMLKPAGDTIHRKEDEKKVMRKMDEQKVMRKMDPDRLQKKEVNHNVPPTAKLIEQDLASTKGQGAALPDTVRKDMEKGFGTDLREVRIHTGDTAAKMNKALQAKAFTHGNDIYFNEGNFNPLTREGKILLAHELTHTIQQRSTITEKPPEAQQAPPQTVQREEDNAELKKELEAADQAAKQAIDPGPAKRKRAEADNKKAETARKAQSKHNKKKGGGGKKGAKKPGPGGAKSKSAGAMAAAEAALKQKLGTVGKDLSNASAFACAKADQKAGVLAGNEQTHDDAAQKQQQTDSAVVPPALEGQSQSNTEQVQGLDAATPPQPDKETARRAMSDSLGAAMPTNIKEINEFESQGKAQVVGNEVLGSVTSEVGQVQDKYNDIEQPPAPKPSETPVELPPQETAPLTPTLNVGKGAVPNLKPEHTDARMFDKQSDDLLTKEGISEDQLNMVDSGELAEANKERQGLKKKVKEEPLKIQQEAKKETQQVEKDLLSEESKGKTQMRQKRTAGLNTTKDKQQKTKTDLEKKREEVTAKINGIYERAKKSVTDKLSNLEKQNLTDFDAGQAAASKQFEREVKRDIDAWKSDRYSGLFGGVKWIKDKFVGIDDFPEVKQALSNGRENYIKRIDALIVSIDRANQQVIKDCKLELANAQKEIQNYVKTLGPELRDTGQKALKEMQTKLAEMDKFIDEQKNKLREKLCSKREEAIKKIDEKIEKMKEEMSGLISKLGNLILEALVKFFKWALEKAGYAPDKLMEIINKGKAVIKIIVTSPGTFFGNLAKAVKGGIDGFKKNIQQHLIKGVVGWLTGAMSDAGIQLPSTWDIKGIFFLLLQILNLTKEAIIKKLSDKIGAPVVEGAMKVAGFVKRVIDEGPMALWDMLVEQAEMLKERVMETIRNWISMEMIKQGIIKLVSMLNPVGAIVQLIIGIYNAVMFFVENWSRIVEFVKTIFNSIADIAFGRLAGAMAAVENALAMTIPIILNFIARMLGLSGIGKAIKKAIEAVRAPIDKIIDKGLDVVGKAVQAIVKKVKGTGKSEKEAIKDKDDKTDDKDKIANPPDKIGETVPFSTPKHSHKVYISRKGNTYKVIVESTPQEVLNQIEAWRTELKKPEWNKREVSRDNIRDHLTKVKKDLLVVETESKQVEDAVEKGQTPKDTKLRNAEARLSDSLKIIFQEFEKFDDKLEADFKTVFVANLNNVHPEARTVVLDTVDKINIANKGEGFANIREWSGLLGHIIKTDPAQDLYVKPMGSKSDAGYRGHAYKQVMDRAAHVTILKGATPEKIDKVTQNVLKGVTAGTQVFLGLRDQIFDKALKNEVNTRIDSLYNSEGEHTRYHPENITFAVENDEFVFTYTYKSEPGEKSPTFTVRIKAEKVADRKVVTQTVTGTNLALKDPGTRGVTQTVFNDQPPGAQPLNSAHVIADRFMGSGYKSALNLIATSKEFNQEDMANAEDEIADEIKAIHRKNPGADISFTLKVTVIWKTMGDSEVLKQFDKLDNRLTEDDIKQVHAVMAKKQDPRRCELVTYVTTPYKNGEKLPNLDVKTIGPDTKISVDY